MAEIRCQMCGKSNPAEAEVCQFCQARLKPVWASKSEENFYEAEPEPEGEGVPDWLRDLRGSEEIPAGSTSPEPADESLFSSADSGDLSGGEDWLASLGKAEVEPDAVSSVFDLQSDEDLSGWLPGIKPRQENDVPPSAEEVELPPAPLFSDQAPAQPAFGEESEPPDWLKHDWSPQPSDEGQPKSFESDQPLTPPGEEVPDWLARMTFRETDIPEEAQSFPEWMQGDGQIAAEFTPEAGMPAAQEPSSDWLSGILGSKDEAPPASEDEFSSFYPEGAKSDQSFEPQPAATEGFDAGLDWSKGILRDSSSEPEEAEPVGEIVQPSIPGAEGFPDWLSALGVTSDQETPQTSREQGAALATGPELTGEEQPAARETPDWLAGVSEESSASQGSIEEKPATPAFVDSDDMLVAGLDETMPEWLTNLDTSGAPVSTGGPSPFVFDEVGEAQPESAFAPAIKDWLSEAMPEPSEAEPPSAPAPQEPEPELEPGLAPAELPTWLAAMRPVEAGASEAYKDAGDARVERAGPLAGLRGALPAGPSLPRVGKSSLSALKIQVPEEQQNRASVLRQLLEDESTPKALPAPSVAAIPLLLRLAVFGIFVLGSLFAIWLGGKQVPLPSSDIIPQAVLDFHAGVESLPAGVPVLFAVDYEPGFSGELDGAAASVLRQLAGKGSLVTFVSTTYNGPVLAQRLVEAVNQQDLFLQNPFANFRNMGYIPGGTAGLAAFAKTPAEVLPYDLNDNFLWASAPFDGTRGLNNFAMLVVVTHDADTARQWIEQIGLTLEGIPLQLVVSAQAEPLVMPYYQGYPRQVSGVVSGLAGGVAYETLEGFNGKASQSWDAYSISITLAVVLILAGGLSSLGSFTLSQYKQTKAEGKA